jgi:hypothetical protein
MWVAIAYNPINLTWFLTDGKRSLRESYREASRSCCPRRIAPVKSALITRIPV